jgi:hypothetical protein
LVLVEADYGPGPGSAGARYSAPGRQVLFGDRPDDQAIGQQADQVVPGRILVLVVGQRGNDPVHRLDPEGQGEIQEEAVAGRAPEAQEEQADDEGTHGDRAGDQVGHAHSFS